MNHIERYTHWQRLKLKISPKGRPRITNYEHPKEGTLFMLISYRGILFNLKKEGNSNTGYDMDETRTHYVK